MIAEMEAGDPTNSLAERVRRYPVILRKRSLGTWNESDDCCAKGILYIRQACRGHFTTSSIADDLKDQTTDVAWIATLA